MIDAACRETKELSTDMDVSAETKLSKHSSGFAFKKKKKFLV